MSVILGSDRYGYELKEVLKKELLAHNYDVIDVTETKDYDFIDASLAAAKLLYKNDGNFGIIIDAWGSGPFMTLTRLKGIIAAQVSDERSAYMTRAHNNAHIITIGSKITGPELAVRIAHAFLQGSYEGGRHQIRVDMLNKMGRYLPELKEG